MVPQILPEEEEEEEVHHRASIRDKGPILSLGFYVQQASLTFKVYTGCLLLFVFIIMIMLMMGITVI